jgi:hypothetical protein
MNQNCKNQTDQNQSGSIDPLALSVLNALKKSGCEAQLRFPTAEEREQLEAEKIQRDLQTERRRLENQALKMTKLKQRAREIFQRIRDEQV